MISGDGEREASMGLCDMETRWHLEGDGGKWTGKIIQKQRKEQWPGMCKSKGGARTVLRVGRQPRGQWDGEEAGKEAAGPESLRALGALQGLSGGGLCLT